MSLMKYNPLYSPLANWPDFWDDELMSPLTSAASNLDVYETYDEVVVKANVAGVPSDKVDLTFEKGVLWIKAEAVEEKDDKEKKHYSKSSWNYSYKVAVPSVLDNNVEPDAMVKDGVLTVKFKKSEHTKPRKLNVRTS
ncbi:MAG: Hsp20/alpha crystallin family protein [Candidatus Pacebacteria bacterium]|nr:Hsp20/alpha crystallin family protein [Candidatus Paceibacterota bacterium]